LSDYFLNLNSNNRIPRSELISLITSSVKDIHSLDIKFVSKKNEDYHDLRLQSLVTAISKL
jgi:hypothetical protein